MSDAASPIFALDPARIREQAMRVLYEIATDSDEKPTDRRQAASDLLKMVEEAPDAERKALELTDNELLAVIAEWREEQKARAVPRETRPTPTVAAHVITSPSNEGVGAAAAGPGVLDDLEAALAGIGELPEVPEDDPMFA